MGYAGTASLTFGPRRWVAVCEGLTPTSEPVADDRGAGGSEVGGSEVGGARAGSAVVGGAVVGGAAAYGLVGVPPLAWTDVTALFTDEPAAFAAVGALHGRVAGRPLVEVLADEGIAAASAAYDLLWYAPGELDRID